MRNLVWETDRLLKGLITQPPPHNGMGMSRRETEREIKDTQYRVNTLPIRELWGLNLSGGPEMKIHRIIEFA